MSVALRVPLWLCMAVALAGGCCKQNVTARAYVGHLTSAQCQQLVQHAEAPVSIICPGEEVTLCWNAGGDGVTNVNIAVTPDPGGASGTKPTSGVAYLTPTVDTTIKVTASDCASTTKLVTVLSSDVARPGSFDATWDLSCGFMSYTLDPVFISPRVLAVDDEALWNPSIGYYDEQTGYYASVDCTQPPFLTASHTSEPFGFRIDHSFTTVSFGRPHPATGTWSYNLVADCHGPYTCNTSARLPFAMGLICP